MRHCKVCGCEIKGSTREICLDCEAEEKLWDEFFNEIERRENYKNQVMVYEYMSGGI